MKLMMILSTALLLFAAPVFSQLLPADIDKIRLIVKEEVEQAVTASETRMNKVITASDTRMSKAIEASETRIKDQVSLEISKVNGTIAEMDKRLNYIFTFVIALIALIAVVIGAPQILVFLQRKDQRAQDEKIEAQQKQIEAQQEQIEALQRQMETRPQERTVGP